MVRNFYFSISSRLALGPNQLPIQWVLGARSQGVKRQGREVDQSTPASAEVKKRRSTYPLPHTPSWTVHNFTFTVSLSRNRPWRPIGL
jgi:hypothetical protein